MTRRRVLVVVAAVFVALVAWVLIPPSERPFFDYLAERRAAGLPTTWAELVGAAPPDSENAFVDLSAAWNKLFAEYGPTTEWKGSRWDGSFWDDRAWPDSLDADGRAALAATEERLRPGLVALVASACDKPRFVAPATFGVDGWICQGDIDLLRSLRQTMSITAAADPDPARRVAACRAMLVLAARSESYGPGRDARAEAIAVLRHGVESGFIDAAAARAACDEWLRVPVIDGLRRWLRAEAVKLLDAYASVLSGRTMGWSQRSASERIGALLRLHHDEHNVDWEPGIAADVVASSRAWEDLAATKDDRASADPVALITVQGTPDGRPFAGRQEGYTFARMVRFAKRDDARQALARVALAIAEHRAVHGDFPASLDELKPMFPDGIPLDPFADAAFVYEKTATGVRIASAGPPAENPPLYPATLRELTLVWELRR